MVKLTKKNKFYTTTAIPYVNAEPHIGHALEFVQTDVLKRYYKNKDVESYMVTGADENSLKNVQAAEKKGINTQELCDKYSTKFEEFAKKINLDYDCFRRSSDKEKHYPGVLELWNKCKENGDIYKKKYKGLYCVGCEAFYTENDLEEGLCPEHKTKPEEIEEENYFFRLSKYQDKLKELVEKDELKIYPEFRKKEFLNFIENGLEDFSISRSEKRAKGWGIPVPGDDSQIMYVWFDALSCYLTGVGFGFDQKEFEKWWPCDVHVIGKGITRFHVIYWPAMLLSAGIELPKSIFIHGYVTAEGHKMSKSLGNVLDPMELIEKYGVDQIRYYLLKDIPTFQDGDFSEKRVIEKINNELVANLGNLVNRTMVFISRSFEGKCPSTGDKKIENIVPKYKERIQKIENSIENELNLKEALEEVMLISSDGNKYFQDAKPWEKIRKNQEQAGEDLAILLNLIKDLGILVYPFMPGVSKGIFEQLNLENKKWEELGKITIDEGHELSTPEILFKKMDEKILAKKEKEPEPKKEKGKIEFSDLDIEVGEIISASKHPDAEKLFVEIVELGNGKKQVVSGLAEYYSSPEELIGKKAIILKNLKPAKIRGAVSQGMLLVAENKENEVEIIEPDAEIGEKITFENVKSNPKTEIDIKEFFSIEIKVKDHEIFCNEQKLFAGKNPLKTKKIVEGEVR